MSREIVGLSLTFGKRTKTRSVTCIIIYCKYEKVKRRFDEDFVQAQMQSFLVISIITKRNKKNEFYIIVP